MGDQLTELRETRLGLTQEGLARLLDVSFASVNRWESGTKTGPRGPVLALLRALDAAVHMDPGLRDHLSEWEARGRNYLWAKVFDLARDYESQGREIGDALLPKRVSVGKPEASPNKVRFPGGFELDDPGDAKWLALYLLGWAARARKAT